MFATLSNRIGPHLNGADFRCSFGMLILRKSLRTACSGRPKRTPGRAAMNKRCDPLDWCIVLGKGYFRNEALAPPLSILLVMPPVPGSRSQSAGASRKYVANTWLCGRRMADGWLGCDRDGSSPVPGLGPPSWSPGCLSVSLCRNIPRRGYC